ncbi:MAG: hypothetical protein GXN91_05075 [Epsilonproteobacteria bacterium]|nr:hypothetical protein [Campylobacterota bacterium]
MSSHKYHKKLEQIKDAIANSDLSEEEKSEAFKLIEEWYIEDKAMEMLFKELGEKLSKISAKLTPILKELGLI